ncbi:MAG: mechanosensitive ion channel family protein [Prevotellaceae bacterium]|nr:mechanosensitive ion channel family protein [Prevotella sp.]MDD7256946.1 mechanosensitive ion channel family protein [Prevotellaceae bacterium]MDY6131385.1 mechanosensitive ion channel family protein [Prevotella sp.]
MDSIKIYVEEFIGLLGVTGHMVPVLRHVLLVIVAVGLAAVAGLLCRKLVVPVVMKVTSRTAAKWDDVLLNRKVLVSASHIVPAVVIWQLLPLVFYQYPVVREWLARATAIYITVMSVRLAVVFINSFNDLEPDESSTRQQYLRTFFGVLKIVMIFIAAIVVIAIVMGKNPMALFAGLGATSAILMLVFKDTIEGLVAGIRLTSNEMVQKGDWITVDKAGANGVVESISLTTVKVRNFDNTIVTVTPQMLVNDSFQNWKGMQESEGRRVCRKIFFDFRSVGRMDEAMRQRLMGGKLFGEKELEGEHVNMELFRLYVERYLENHDDVNADMTCMVRHLEATQGGLPLEFYFFLKHKEWVTYEHQLAGIMEWIYAVTAEFGLVIYQQYPEQ